MGSGGLGFGNLILGTIIQPTTNHNLWKNPFHLICYSLKFHIFEILRNIQWGVLLQSSCYIAVEKKNNDNGFHSIPF